MDGDDVRLTDSWSEWTWMEDDVPHEPDMPPPPKYGDARRGEVEVPLPEDGTGWRWANKDR